MRIDLLLILQECLEASRIVYQALLPRISAESTLGKSGGDMGCVSDVDYTLRCGAERNLAVRACTVSISRSPEPKEKYKICEVRWGAEACIFKS